MFGFIVYNAHARCDDSVKWLIFKNKHPKTDTLKHMFTSENNTHFGVYSPVGCWDGYTEL